MKKNNLKLIVIIFAILAMIPSLMSAKVQDRITFSFNQHSTYLIARNDPTMPITCEGHSHLQPIPVLPVGPPPPPTSTDTAGPDPLPIRYLVVGCDTIIGNPYCDLYLLDEFMQILSYQRVNLGIDLNDKAIITTDVKYNYLSNRFVITAYTTPLPIDFTLQNPNNSFIFEVNTNNDLISPAPDRTFQIINDRNLSAQTLTIGNCIHKSYYFVGGVNEIVMIDANNFMPTCSIIDDISISPTNQINCFTDDCIDASNSLFLSGWTDNNELILTDIDMRASLASSSILQNTKYITPSTYAIETYNKVSVTYNNANNLVILGYNSENKIVLLNYYDKNNSTLGKCLFATPTYSPFQYRINDLICKDNYVVFIGDYHDGDIDGLGSYMYSLNASTFLYSATPQYKNKYLGSINFGYSDTTFFVKLNTLFKLVNGDIKSVGGYDKIEINTNEAQNGLLISDVGFGTCNNTYLNFLQYPETFNVNSADNALKLSSLIISKNARLYDNNFINYTDICIDSYYPATKKAELVSITINDELINLNNGAIEFGRKYFDSKLQILDARGASLYKGIINSQEINISEFSSGVYFLFITDKDGAVKFEKINYIK